MLVGIIAMYVSPALNKTPNWQKLAGWHNIISQLTSIAFFCLFYFLSLNMYYRLIAGRQKAVQFIKPTVISFLLIGGYYAASLAFMNPAKMELSVNNKTIENEFTLGVMIFSYIISSIFIIGSSVLIAYFTYLRDEKKQGKVLEEQKMQLEVEKSQANFNFLKAQIILIFYTTR
jgi:uncharacterized membrane protein